eukprot:1021312-Prorocentrum_minimum.AAC.3
MCIVLRMGICERGWGALTRPGKAQQSYLYNTRTYTCSQLTKQPLPPPDSKGCARQRPRGGAGRVESDGM